MEFMAGFIVGFAGAAVLFLFGAFDTDDDWPDEPQTLDVQSHRGDTRPVR